VLQVWLDERGVYRVSQAVRTARPRSRRREALFHQGDAAEELAAELDEAARSSG
jgi:hypothetical protein